MITGRHEFRNTSLSKMSDSQLVYVIHLATETGNCIHLATETGNCVWTVSVTSVQVSVTANMPRIGS